MFHQAESRGQGQNLNIQSLMFQVPNSRAVNDTTDWQNGRFDSSLGPVLHLSPPPVMSPPPSASPPVISIPPIPNPVPPSLDRQTEANVSPFESAHNAAPFVTYQSMPYSAARLSRQTFEDQSPALRLMPPQEQSDLDSSAFMRSPTDRGMAASEIPAPSDDMNELLKLRSMIQAVGSRGLFPIQ